MNLKDAFRYQNFLTSMHQAARIKIQQEENCLTTVVKHLRHAANPEAQDITEESRQSPEYKPEDIIRLMNSLTEDKIALTAAITKAKVTLPFDLDAAVEGNKLRQATASSIKLMLMFTPKSEIKRDGGRAYKFNVEGNQTEYVYDLDIETKETFDRAKARKIMREIIRESEKVSAEIEAAMTTQMIDFTPKYDVNDEFEDVMETFLKAA